MKTIEIDSSADTICVSGGNTLVGEVTIAGYKHALTLLVAASILASNDTTIHNVPVNAETQALVAILQDIGVNVFLADHSLRLNSGQSLRTSVPQDLSQQIHSSLYLIPALLGRLGRVHFGGAGGDR